jgi:heat shock protein HslJ
MAAIALLGAGCGGDDGEVTDLDHKDWRIDVVSADGDRREVDPAYDAVLRFDGDGGFEASMCNDIHGDVTITSSELTWGNVWSTLAGCLDDDLTWLETAVSAVFDSTARWTLTDGVLRIEGEDVVVELGQRPDGFPRDLVQLATSDPAGESQWQFGYAEIERGSGYDLWWEGRAAPGTAFRDAGIGADPSDVLKAMWVEDVDGGLFAFGFVPEAAESVVFDAVDNTREVMTTYDLPDGSRVYGAVVTATPGRVVALDADGTEFGRSDPSPVH